MEAGDDFIGCHFTRDVPLDLCDPFDRRHWLQIYCHDFRNDLLLCLDCWQVQSPAQNLAPAARCSTEVYDSGHSCRPLSLFLAALSWTHLLECETLRLFGGVYRRCVHAIPLLSPCGNRCHVYLWRPSPSIRKKRTYQQLRFGWRAAATMTAVIAGSDDGTAPKTNIIASVTPTATPKNAATRMRSDASWGRSTTLLRPRARCDCT